MKNKERISDIFITETGLDNVDCFYLAQGKDQWNFSVTMAMNINGEELLG